MSLRYRLFKIPANEEEAVAKARKENKLLEVYAHRKNLGTLVPDAQRFEYNIGIKVGRTRIVINRFEKSFNNFVQGLDDSKGDFVFVDSLAESSAKKLAEDLSLKGVPVLCGNEIYVSSN